MSSKATFRLATTNDSHKIAKLFRIASGGVAEYVWRAFEQNEEAVRLYERKGFEIIDRARVVPHESIRYTGEVLLMTAPV
jgi:hypothetical protein